MYSGKGESLKKNPVFFFLLPSESDTCRQDEVRMESGQTPSLRGAQCRGRGAHRAAAAALRSQRKWRIRDGLVRI